MLEEKKLKEAEKRVKQYVADGIIMTKCKSEHTSFFLKNAEDSIDSAKVLFEISTDPEKQKFLGFTSFNGLLWTVNASYYSMFYMARALLENEGIKIKSDLSIHAVTFDIIVSHFYLTGKLQKELLNDFADAKEDASELLGKQKADELIEEYFYEKNKRSTFTYEMGEILVKSKAKTSLERAQKFKREIKKIIEKKRK
ncbi:hypothetical protein J4476_01060 [Candidatus Woesearchaeota archaeon]|nr:MAG: hypothetical protein QT09_C0008G0053 [archaeon GW2011_AR18]MBS3161268.1 hypothetical protein [Candidatus Woesearchaeota archaeon]HIH25678.1 hypothetical protein [Nanoarchaeota archaeon]